MRRLQAFALLLAAFVITGAFAVQAQDIMLEIGDDAPTFEAPTADGAIWHSAKDGGDGLLVVYFYPAAMTGGCTKQACAFRDDRSKLVDMGAQVVAVSGDPVENLQVFKKAHRLNFPLLSDVDGRIAQAFGVPLRAGGEVKQTVDGKEVTLKRDVTASRWTFIISPEGKIVYKDTAVDAAGDSQAVIAAIEQLHHH